MRKTIFLTLLASLALVSIFSVSYFAPLKEPLLDTYATSQYCLSGYRSQHGWDTISSQYSLWCDNTDKFEGNIKDPELYTLSGILYTKFADPASINPEIQPLTKYLFGFSQSLLGTPLVVQYLAFFVILLAIYYAGKQSLPFTWSLVAPSLLILDLLVTRELGEPYLDLVSTAFVLLFLNSLALPKLSMIILGLAALAKSFSTGIVLALVLFVYLVLTDRQKIVIYLKNLWLAVCTYLLGYSAFFFYHHNPLDFITLHVDILKLYRSYVPEYPPGEIFRIIFTGKWRLWFDEHALIDVPEWTILWPISLLASIIAVFLTKLRTNPTLLPHLL